MLCMQTMPKINRSMTPSRNNVAQRKPIAKPHMRRLLKFSNISLRLSSFCLIGLLGLSACTTDPSGHKAVLAPGVLKEQQAAQSNNGGDGSKPDVVIEANPDQLNVSSDAELASDPSLPKQDLDATTLENLLLMNFASFQGDWSKATDSAISAAQSSQDFRVARSATLLALRNSDYSSAADASAIWLALKPDSVNAQNMNIIALLGTDKVDEVKLAIEQQLADQDIDDYIKQLAGLIVRQSNIDAGFAITEHMVKQYPDSAQTQISAAYIAQRFEKFELAEKWAARALVLRPEWDLVAQVTANLLGAQNKVEQRAEFIERFVAQNPRSIAMRINHAAELGRAEKFDEAYQLTIEVLEDEPKNVNALQYAAALAEQLNDTKLSARHLRKALDVEPKNDDVRWSLARLAVMDKKYATAERLFDQITDEEIYVRAQIQVANMRAETQSAQLALNTLRALQPRTEQDYLAIATTRHYLLMGDYRYEDAFSYVNQALVYSPENLDLLYARALVAAELRKLEVVEQDLGFIISKEPDHANALNALGYTLADQTDRYEEAKGLIEKALKIEPDQAHILDSMGWVAYKLNDFSTAIEYLQKAYDSSPEAEIAAHLAEVLLESGETEKAIGLLKESFSKDDKNPVLNKVIERYELDISSLDILPAEFNRDANEVSLARSQTESI